MSVFERYGSTPDINVEKNKTITEQNLIRNDIPTYSRPTASVDIYRCPMCGEEFIMNYKAPYCDHCGAEFEPMENPRGDL